MAFTFNSTVGNPAANSYVSVEAANDYFFAHLERSYWDSLVLKDKQAALVMATRRIDSERFDGYPTNGTQSLQWPRQSVLSRNYGTGNVIIPNTEIPSELTEATFEMALFYLRKAQDETTTVDDYDLETLTQYRIGPIGTAIKPGVKADRLPTKVMNLLRAIGPTAWMGADTGYSYGL